MTHNMTYTAEMTGQSTEWTLTEEWPLKDYATCTDKQTDRRTGRRGLMSVDTDWWTIANTPCSLDDPLNWSSIASQTRQTRHIHIPTYTSLCHYTSAACHYTSLMCAHCCVCQRLLFSIRNILKYFMLRSK